MKQILYILSMVSLLAVACTKEIPVSRDYDFGAEVGGITTTMEMKTLYCNLADVAEESLEGVGEYITETNADVVTLVAPATINGAEGSVDVVTWLSTYATAHQYKVLSATLAGNPLVMAALVKTSVIDETGEAEALRVVLSEEQQAALNPILHFEVNDVHFVVTEIKDSKNAIPENWEELVKAMNKNNNTLTYDPDNHVIRNAELAYLLAQTVNNREYKDEKYWMWGVNMNAPSKTDIVKYQRTFLREDCYDNVTPEFLAKKTSYFSVSEYVDVTDGYFALNDAMIQKFDDFAATQYSVYVPSSTDGSRHNFMYVSKACSNIIEAFETVQDSNLNLTHYPIVVTLKSEE